MHKKQVSSGTLTGAMIISMFLWGLSWPSGKVLTRYCSAVNFAVYRYVIVVAVMLLLLKVLKAGLLIRKEGIPFVLASGLLLALYSYLFFIGLQKGSPGAGGVLVTTLNPIMAYAIGIFLSRKLPARNEAIGLVLGIIAGCALLKVWDNSSRIIDSGNLYFLLAAFLWASMSKFTSKGAKYGSPLTFSFWQYMVTLLCLLPMTNFKEAMLSTHLNDALFWGNLFFSSAIVTALATTVFFYSTTRLGAEKASSFLFMVPLAASVSSWLLLGEIIHIHTAIGGVLGIMAVYMINKKRVVEG